jgi:hypothetical protein
MVGEPEAGVGKRAAAGPARTGASQGERGHKAPRGTPPGPRSFSGHFCPFSRHGRGGTADSGRRPFLEGWGDSNPGRLRAPWCWRSNKGGEALGGNSKGVKQIFIYFFS